MAELDRPDGTRIHYQVEGQGPAVVCIQGVGMGGVAWRPQVEALREGHRVVWIDNRGIGGSTLSGELGIEHMADDALAVMDALEMREAHVIGHSMGGVIAQELALRAKDRVRSLSLLCTFARGKDAVSLSPGMMWIGLRTRIGTRRMRRHAFLEMVMPASKLAGDRDALAEELGAVFGRDLADQPAIAMKQLGALGRHDASGRLGQLASVPTLVVSASEDRIARPRFGRQIAELIGGARYLELDDAAHAVPVHDAPRVNALLLEHLAACAQRAA